MVEKVKFQTDGRTAYVTLDHPERRNAIDLEMLSGLEDILHRLDRDPVLELVVLRATGTSFCAGTDLKQLRDVSATDTLHWQRRTGMLVERWSRLDLTTLTVFNGPAIGSGAVLGIASDIRLASDTTFFRFPELQFGIPLTWSGIPLLVTMLGPERVKKALLLGARLDADELLGISALTEVVPIAQLNEACERLVSALLDLPRLARSMTKRAIAAASAAPGLASNGFEPFLASLSIASRPRADFL